MLESNLATLLAHTKHETSNNQVYLSEVDAYLTDIDLKIRPTPQEAIEGKKKASKVQTEVFFDP